MDHLFIFPDTHVPYHHKRYFELALKACQSFRPKKGSKYRVVIGGDFADCYTVSDHDKNPGRSTSFEWEMDEVNRALDALQQAAGPDATIDYVEGNHENRLDRFLMRKAPELYGLCKYREFTRLNERGIRFHPYRKHMTVGKLYITHDTGQAGKYAHYKAQEIFQSNAVINHTHRIGYAVVGNAAGKPHVAAMFGHLSDIEQVDYAHRIQVARDWAYGFGHGYIDPEGITYLVPSPIVKNAAMVGGNLIKG